MPSSCNPTTGSFRSIDLVRRETAISGTVCTIVAPQTCSISWTPSATIPPRDSPTANPSLHACWRSSTFEKPWVGEICLNASIRMVAKCGSGSRRALDSGPQPLESRKNQSG
jgi:hypothetical protein